MVDNKESPRRRGSISKMVTMALLAFPVAYNLYRGIETAAMIAPYFKNDAFDAAVLESCNMVKFPLSDSSKWLDDIDHAANPNGTACGMFKCLHESRTNARCRVHRRIPRYGYLVAKKANGVHDGQHRKTLSPIKRGWEKATELSEKFLLRHLLLAEPVVTTAVDVAFAISREDRSERRRYASLSRGGSSNGNGNGNASEIEMSNASEIEMIIQPVRLAPKGSYEFGCKIKKLKKGGDKLDKFARSAANDTDDNNGNDPSERQQRLRQFEERLRFDLNATLRALDSIEGGCLAKDFQVIIDPNEGSIYHLDFDRCYGDSQEEPVKCAGSKCRFVAVNCAGSLRDHAEELLEVHRHRLSSSPFPDNWVSATTIAGRKARTAKRIRQEKLLENSTSLENTTTWSDCGARFQVLPLLVPKNGQTDLELNSRTTSHRFINSSHCL